MVSDSKAHRYSRLTPFLFTVMLITSAAAEDVWTDTTLTTGSPYVLRDITWGDGRFVAVGDSGVIMTSPDGILWEQRESGSDQNCFSVCWGGGQFLAVGVENIVLASLDGKEWSLRNTWIQPPFGHDPNFSFVGYGNGTYVASGGITIYSQDGIDWFMANNTQSFYDISYGNGIFLGISGMYPSTSENGRQWNSVDDIPSIEEEQMPGGPIQSPIGPSLSACAYGNGIFMIVGTNPPIMTSENGINWAIVDSGNPYNDDIVFNGDEFIIVGDKIYATTNGDEKSVIAESYCQSIACNDSVCVALLNSSSDVVVLKKHPTSIDDNGLPHVKKTANIRTDAGFLHIPDAGRKTRITLYDVSGRAVPLQRRGAHTGSVSIPIDHLSRGMYLVRVKTSETTYHAKVMIGTGR